ncbi:hypothetical protein WT12_08345 [Burkholderia territorii]|uniref:hypothetical protein n=1 Tax=Burkholderia territorii TaxID=1503055 RepID=UPI000758C7F7|nr:hypothetical protein [Burkholderia territorii]KVN48746.1 hypothetical protein WT12_08345 [Burkholderia territorii]
MQIQESIKAWRHDEQKRERVRGKAGIALAIFAAVVLWGLRNNSLFAIVVGSILALGSVAWCFAWRALPDGQLEVFDDCLLWIARDTNVPEFAKALIAIEVDEATQSGRSYIFAKLYALDDRLAELAWIERVESGEGYRAIMAKRPAAVEKSEGEK